MARHYKVILVSLGHDSVVLCMAASEPDRELFTGSSDSTARSWNVETGQPLSSEYSKAIKCQSLVRRLIDSHFYNNLRKCV